MKNQAKTHIDGTEFDTQIAIIIPAIRAAAEQELGRRLITQTVEMVLDEFPSEEIDLILPDAQSITSIKYLDDSGVEQTLAGSVYALDADSTPSRVLLKYGQAWPSTQDVQNAVRVRFVVGYGDAAAVPSNVKLWIIAQCCAALKGELTAAGHRVVGVTVTTFGVDGAPVDARGTLLYPIISWKCPRTAAVMANRVGVRV